MIRIAFVKYAGLTAGGTERWMQLLAINLPRDEFDVTYFWSDAAPYTSGKPPALPTDAHRRDILENAGIRSVQFHVEAVDDMRRGRPWLGSNFFDLFSERDFDIVQCAKEGPPEYPFVGMQLPVFEQVAYNGGVDHSANIACSTHWSEWQRAWWYQRGGRLDRSFVSPIPVLPPASSEDLRAELSIPEDAPVVGFHQRVDDRTKSDTQLDAIARLGRADLHVVVLGGSHRYADQARALGLPNVHFLDATGHDQEISRFLNTLDVFTHGRRDGETFGAVLAEALSHGVPCISHRVAKGANAQLETIGPGGFVTGSVAEYAARLSELLGDRSLRDELAVRGLAHVRRRFSLERVVRRFGESYKDVAAGGRPRLARDSSYGECPHHYLVHGQLEDRGTVSHSVLTGTMPHASELALLGQLGPRLGEVVEIGAADPLFALEAASRLACRVVVVEAEPETCGDLVRTIDLNRWDDRIELIHHPSCRSQSDQAVRERQGPIGLRIVRISESCGTLVSLPDLGAAVVVTGSVRRRIGPELAALGLDVPWTARALGLAVVRRGDSSAPASFGSFAGIVRRRDVFRSLIEGHSYELGRWGTAYLTRVRAHSKVQEAVHSARQILFGWRRRVTR